MEHRRINKIIKFRRLLFAVIFPFLILILCVKGDFGNFESNADLTRAQEEYKYYSMSGNTFESSRTRSIFLTTISIANHFQVEIPGDLYQFSKFDIGFSEHKAFSWVPPGTAAVGSIFFTIFREVNLGQLGAYLSIVLVSVCVHFLIFKILKTFLVKSDGIALLGAYIYTFATIAFAYSTTFFQHQYTVLAICIMLFGLWKTAKEKRVLEIWSYVIPLTYGLSVFFDYPNLILLLPLIFSWFLLGFEVQRIEANKIWVRAGIIITLCISLLLLFNQKNFNNPLQMTNTLPREHQIGSSNIDEIIKKKNNPLNILRVENVTHGLSMYLFDSKRGIFFFSPILIIGILQIVKLFEKKPRFLVISLSILLINLLLYASFDVPSGGYASGPRYLLPTMFFLSIFTALWVKEASIKKILLVIPLLLLSILNNLSGALTTITIPETMDTTYYGIKNFEFILNNVSGSFIYTKFVAPVPLFYYFLMLLTVLITIFILLLFGRSFICRK